MFAADEFGQVFLTLLRGAVASDLIDTQVAVGAVAQTHRGTGAADFFHGDHVRQVAHVGATIFFTHGDAEHAQAAHFFPQVHRKLVGSVDLCRTRGDLGLGKVAHRVAQCVNVFAELEVEAG